MECSSHSTVTKNCTIQNIKMRENKQNVNGNRFCSLESQYYKKLMMNTRDALSRGGGGAGVAGTIDTINATPMLA